MSASPQQQDNLEILAFGQTTVSKFKKLKIFLYGLKGIGIEIAKNIILLGPSLLTIKDDLLVKPSDLTSNMFLNESHVGKETRARACLSSLSILNSQVSVTVHENEISEDFIKNFDLVIFTKYYSFNELLKLNKFCRTQKKPIGFIMCQTFGVFAYCFVDYGEGFKIYDKDGEEPQPFLISEITKGCPGIVNLIKEKGHNFQDGDFVRIYEVEGMSEVNGADTRPIKVLSPYSFTIEDTKEFSNYVRGGFVEIAKVPFRINFKSLEERILNPFNKLNQDTLDYNQKKKLHLGFLALMEFGVRNNSLPETNNLAHSEEMIKIAKEILEKHAKLENVIKFDELDEHYIKNLSFGAKSQVIPLCSFWGGVMSMEIVKFTGKFIPLQEIYYFNSGINQINVDFSKKEGHWTRYDDQISVLGKETTEKLQRMNVLLVGSGSCGCEILKNLSLMGIASAPSHSIKLVDEAIIKPTQVNSHYWFGPKYVKEYKAKVAQAWVKKINDMTNVEPITSFIKFQSDKIFNDEFWKKIDVIICAIDDDECRRILRNKAIFYEIPLLDSKISGAKAHSQVVIPFKTTPFLNDYLNNQTKIDVGFDFLDSFPYLAEHSVLWGRILFREMFVDFSKQIKSLAANPQVFMQTWDRHEKFFILKLVILHSLFADGNKINSFEDLVVLAKEIFEYLFVFKIHAIFKEHPVDETSENGILFWSGYRKIPKSEEFDLTEEGHMNFIIQTANLFALILNYPQNLKKPALISIIKGAIQNKTRILPNFEEVMEKPEVFIQNLINCPHIDIKVKKINIDDEEADKNLCIDFITISSNLKAKCYSLVELQRYKVEKIAFQIERNIAITQQLVAGILSMELYKILLEKEDTKAFKNTTIDLRFNQYQFVEPSKPKCFIADFDPWKKLEYHHDMSIEELISDIKVNYSVIVKKLAFDYYDVYPKLTEITHNNISVKSNIAEAFKLLGSNVKRAWIEIDVQGTDLEGRIIDFPKIKYHLLK